MNLKNPVMATVLSFAVVAAEAGPVLARAARSSAQTQDAAQATVAKRIGVIKAINGNVVTLSVSGGPEVAVTIQPSARVLRLVPGDKDLKNAAPVPLQELQVGDPFGRAARPLTTASQWLLWRSLSSRARLSMP